MGFFDFIGGERGSVQTEFATPEQKEAFNQFLSQMPGQITAATQDVQRRGLLAAEALGKENQFLTGLSNFNPQYSQVTGPTMGSVTAQNVQANTIGLQPNAFVGQAGGMLAQQMGATPTAQAQQQMAGTLGALGQFTQGAGTGQSAAAQAQLGALGQQQAQATQEALSQLKEQGFAGGGTAGGIGNLASQTAAGLAGQFAGQRANVLEAERQAALQAAQTQGQIAQGMGQLGVSQAGLGIQAAGQLGELGGQQQNQLLQAAMANQGTALQAGIANQGAGLQAAGLNVDLQRLGQQAQIANQGAGLQASGLSLDAMRTGAGFTQQQNQALAGLLAQSPQMQALQAQFQMGQFLNPAQAAVSGRGSMLSPIAQTIGAVV